jgi:predicted nucleotidyltransferase component of viral defense system
MNETNFKKYAKLIKPLLKVDESLIEKDYVLSLFLTNAKKLLNEGSINHFKNLIFKGGTLLTKAYLDYHRISEDLDFTHKNSNEIRELSSKNLREKEIKKLIIPLIEEIKKISDYSGLKFEMDRNNTKFIEIKNSRNVYILKVYYTSLITDSESNIKIEINFIEEVLNAPLMKEIILLSDKSKLESNYLKSIKYDLEKISILSYPLEEIILEKYRAILTRKELKERDIFDLYLINSKINVFKVDNTLIIKKINDNLTLKESKSNFESNKKKIINNTFWNSADDIKRLSLIPINTEDYNNFKEKLAEKIIIIIIIIIIK